MEILWSATLNIKSPSLRKGVIMIKTVRKWISHTDRSHYKPNVNLLNNVIGSSNSDIAGLYDFEDGKDNGTRYHDIRDLGADRVEIDNAIDSALKIGNNIRNKLNNEIETQFVNEVSKMKATKDTKIE